ncbi:MAG: restriction endonuclease subunit S [Cyanobacteriota bacterium]|jgi:type I restriction enzyme S subunit
MELKPGYKQTEVGVIPEDWDVRRLSDLAKIRSGIAKNANTSLCNPVTVPYLRVANVQDGFLDLGEVSSISIGRDDLERYLLRSGDVLMNEGGDLDKLGRGAIWRGELKQCIHQNHVFAIRCTSALLPEYLNAWASGKAARRYFVVAGKQTTNLASINKTAIGGLPIALPSPREQQQIAEAIDSLSAYEASIEDLISKKKQVKQAAMQELLTGKRRLPGFEGEWEVKRLGEIGSTYGGLTGKTKSDFGNGDAHYVTFMNVMMNVEVNCACFERVRVAPNESQNRVLRGDLLFNGSSETPDEVAMCSLLTSDVSDLYLNSFCFGYRIRADAPVSGLFLAYLVRSNVGREVFKSLAQGSTRYNLAKSALLDAAIQLPTFGEQTAIATVLSDMDAELASLEARLGKARELKQGMMQQLLTGKIRTT